MKSREVASVLSGSDISPSLKPLEALNDLNGLNGLNDFNGSNDFGMRDP